MSKHALLAPSSSERWLNCPPSAVQESKEPYSTSIEAERGTLAHDLGECLIRQQLHEMDIQKMNQEVLSNQIRRFEYIQKHELYDNEMLDYCYAYRDFVIQAYGEALAEDPEAVIFLEVDLILTEFIPESFGRSDVIIISAKRLHNIDLKYGRGQVSPIQNPQLKIYTLGALVKFDFLFTPEELFLTIYQPRIGNIETWLTKASHLFAWGYDTLKFAARMAFKGEGDYSPGTHCHFCKIKHKCRAAKNNYDLVASREFTEPHLLREDEIEDLLANFEVVEDWIESIKKYALEQAVTADKKWKGFKVVEGKSNRVYTDEQQVEFKLLASKVPKDKIYKPLEVWGITEMEKKLGTEKFNEYLGLLITKPQGANKLVPESNSKPARNTLKKAQNEFTVITESAEITLEDWNNLL